jgi:hypothetical protein
MNNLDNVTLTNTTMENGTLNNAIVTGASIIEPTIISLQLHTRLSINGEIITAQDLLEIVKLKEKMKSIHPELFTM